MGSDSVSAETPQRVNYTFQYADSGPDPSVVWSATTKALSSQLAKAKLKIQY